MIYYVIPNSKEIIDFISTDTYMFSIIKFEHWFMSFRFLNNGQISSCNNCSDLIASYCRVFLVTFLSFTGAIRGKGLNNVSNWCGILFLREENPQTFGENPRNILNNDCLQC